ncbi:hypothetical protein C8Q74DRAFT_1372444 [Fomes fomentarius]|nr:hypothetical protein C8Q74DRAFT_1372444 [Fomes fomentarius]
MADIHHPSAILPILADSTNQQAGSCVHAPPTATLMNNGPYVILTLSQYLDLLQGPFVNNPLPTSSQPSPPSSTPAMDAPGPISTTIAPAETAMPVQARDRVKVAASVQKFLL